MFLYLVLSNLPLVLPSLWCHKFLPHVHKVLWYIYLTLNLKAYNKLRRATDIICHSLSKRRSIFNTFWWLKLSNVTGCFTACVGVHFPVVKLENEIQFRDLCQGLVAQLQIVPLYWSLFPSKHVRAWSVSM